MRVLFLIFLIFFTYCKNENSFNPEAIKGFLDLSKQSTLEYGDSNLKKENESINLKGEWEFYWREFPETEEDFAKLFINNNAPTKNYIKLPSTWNNFKYLDPISKNTIELPSHGYAAYRLRVLLPSNRKDLSLEIADIGMSYALYLNRTLVHKNGIPGKSFEQTNPLLKYRVIKIDTPSEELEIVFVVSNFQYMESGIWGNVRLGSTEEILASRQKEKTVDFIVLGSLLIMGFYHLGIFLFRKKDHSPFYFGLFCLLVALRVTAVGERFILDWISSLPFWIVFKMDFFSFYFGISLFALFLFHVFREEFNKRVLLFFLIMSIPSSLLVIFTPLSIYPRILYIIQATTLLLAAYSIFVLIKAIKNKRTGATNFLIGAIPFCLSVVNDILHAGQVIHTFYIASYGLLIFIFSQSIVLSRRFSLAFYTSEKLSEELQRKTESLEKSNLALFQLKENLSDLVKERTNELENSKKEIETLNKLSQAINENLDLKQIMNKVMEFVTPNFKIENYGLYLVDTEKQFVNCELASSFLNMTEEQRQYVLSTPISLTARRGIHAKVFKSKQIIHFPRIPRSELEVENRNSEIYQMKSFVSIPLILREEVIGILDFFSTEFTMTLQSDGLYKLSVLADQIVGAIYNARLLRETLEAKKISEREKQRSENLLLNILPEEVAQELKEKGTAEPVSFESVSVLFTDFKGFTKIAEKMSPNELIRELDACFVQFDKITERFNLEKLKTIGDSYMCAGGIPKPNKTNPIDTILAALEIQSLMNQIKELKKKLNNPYWELRIGIHTGPLVAGVIGEKKFAYDVWGDTVNTASRMESSGSPGMINISGYTYEKVKDFFDFEYRGKINAKNKGDVDMYFVLGIKKEFSIDGDGKRVNEKFMEIYNKLNQS